MQRVVITMTYEDEETEHRIMRYVSDQDTGETSITLKPSLLQHAIDGLRMAADALEENKPA